MPPSLCQPISPLRRLAVSACLGAALVALGPRAHAADMAEVPSTARGPDFVEVVKRFDGAVVNIAISGVNPLAKPKDQSVHGEGSGFLVRSDGLILTNAHVVKGARHIVVKLKDRREFDAQVLGLDERTDVAVLAIEASGLPTVNIGHDADLQVGEWVLAIGSPFGFEHSVSAGVVSARQRLLPGPTAIPVIQTDVAVNPGNSGGPLLNARGQVVGINAAIYSDTGGYQGLSFAIPIDLAMRVKDQILAQGHATHARVGISTQTLNLPLARSFGLAQPRGVLVLSVDPSGPGASAGLKSGDVVLSVNDQPLRDPDELPVMVAMAQPGDVLRMVLWRDGREQHTLVTLAEVTGVQASGSTHADPPKRVARAARPPQVAAATGPLGLRLRPAGKRDGTHTGAAVVQAVSGSALEAGLAQGDVILAVNGRSVQNVAQARHALASAGPDVALLVERHGERAFIPVTQN
jgi:serine protease Do